MMRLIVESVKLKLKLKLSGAGDYRAQNISDNKRNM